MAKAKIEAARYPHAQALRKRVFAILALANAVAISIQPRHHDCAEEYQYQHHFQTSKPHTACRMRVVICISSSYVVSFCQLFGDYKCMRESIYSSDKIILRQKIRLTAYKIAYTNYDKGYL